MWYCNRIMIVTNGFFYISSFFCTIFACSPRAAFWNPLIEDSRCLNNQLRILVTCAYNIISDIVILILPSRVVWKLRIPTRKKAEIVLLFAIGLLYVGKTRFFSNSSANTLERCRACIANGMLIYYGARLQEKNADVSYNILWEGSWAGAEICFGIIVTCMFTLPQFIEAKGAKIRIFGSSLIRPLKLFTSGSFRRLMPSNKDITVSRGTTLNRIDTSDHSTGDLSFTNIDRDLEIYPSSDATDDFNRYPSVKATDTPLEV